MLLEPIRVDLTKEQLDYCHREGTWLHERAKGRGYDPKDGAPRDEAKRLKDSIDGVIGECCFSVAYHIKNWKVDRNAFKKPDCGGHQVRSTPNLKGKLIVRPNDEICRPEPFALVFVDATGGWVWRYSILGHRAMDKNFWKGNAWFVPREELVNPIQIARKYLDDEFYKKTIHASPGASPPRI